MGRFAEARETRGRLVQGRVQGSKEVRTGFCEWRPAMDLRCGGWGGGSLVRLLVWSRDALRSLTRQQKYEDPQTRSSGSSQGVGEGS